MIDYSADAPKGLSERDLNDASLLAVCQIDLEDELARAESKVEQIKEKLREIREKMIPDFLKRTGISEVKLSDGNKIIVKDQVFATIKEENREAAFAWLKSHNFEDLIKNQVILNFGKGEDNRAALLVEELAQRGFVLENKKAVHPQTLKAFVREQLADPESTLPHATFSVTVVPTTKIERRK